MGFFDRMAASGWFVPGALLLGLALGLAVWLAERERARRLQGRLGQTALARLGAPLPAPVALLARLGEGRGARDSAGVLVLTVTPGVRLLSVGLTALMLWLVWTPPVAPAGGFGGPVGEFVPGGVPVKAALTALLALGVLYQFLFEARVDRERLQVSVLGLWRREFPWRDLRGIDDAGGYEYRLDFGTRRMRLPKYLVGMPGMLAFIGEVLARNAGRPAPTR